LHVTSTRIATNADKRDGQWANFAKVPWGPHSYKNLFFGYTNYHGDNSRDIWFDNVATSTQRIGCGSDYKINAPLHNSTRYPNYTEEEKLPEPRIVK
jgi:hypothetical protein